MLDDMLVPDRIAVSPMRSWMNGTTVELGTNERVKAFHPRGHVADKPLFKTVNLYSLSATLWREIALKLEERIRQGRVGDYYETVFAEMVAGATLILEAVLFDEKKWFEVDTPEDLAFANTMFWPSSEPRSHKLGLHALTNPSVPTALR